MPYSQHTWSSGELATAAKLNNIETGVAEAKSGLDGKTELNVYSATIPTTGWTEYQTGLYTVTVSVNGILANDTTGFVGLVQTGTESSDATLRSAYNTLTRVTSANDAIIIYASQVPEVAIPVNIEVFR